MLKKEYIIPNLLVLRTEPTNVLVTSGATETYYQCPHVPDTRCDIYNEYMHQEEARVKAVNKKIVFVASSSCPYRRRCKLYGYYIQAYMESHGK